MAMGSWPEVPLKEVRTAFKGRYEVYNAIEFWVREKEWRVRGQGHKYALYPPHPGVRLDPPTFVRVDGTPNSDATWQAKQVHRNCNMLERRIKDLGDVDEDQQE